MVEIEHNPVIGSHLVMPGIANGQNAFTFLNDGANSEYVDFSYTQKHNLPLIKLNNPLALGLANGSTAAEMIEYRVSLELTLGNGHKETRTF